MTHDPAVAELLSFFDFAHLRERTPHLAAASEPFHEAAHALIGSSQHRALATLETLAWSLDHDSREGSEAAAKLAVILRGAKALEHWDSSRAGWLRLLLEAKDCAVRAALVRHRAEQPAKPLTYSDVVAGIRDGSLTLALAEPGTIDDPAAYERAKASGSIAEMTPDAWEPTLLLALLQRLGREPATPALAEAFEAEVRRIAGR
jgi:hypothetical protein